MSTTLQLPYKRFVRQVSNGCARSRYSYKAMQSDLYQALQAASWKEATCDPATVTNTVNKVTATDAVVDSESGEITTPSTYSVYLKDNYDAYMQGGDAIKENATMCGYAGCVAYRFTLPTAHSSTIKQIVLGLSRDRYLRAGVRIVLNPSDSETPDSTWQLIRGTVEDDLIVTPSTAATGEHEQEGVNSWGACNQESVNTLVSSRAGEELLTFDEAEYSAYFATWQNYTYLYVYITLEDYESHWKWYNQTEERYYAIEGSAMLVPSASKIVFTDSGVVRPSDADSLTFNSLAVKTETNSYIKCGAYNETGDSVYSEVIGKDTLYTNTSATARAVCTMPLASVLAEYFPSSSQADLSRAVPQFLFVLTSGDTSISTWGIEGLKVLNVRTGYMVAGTVASSATVTINSATLAKIRSGGFDKMAFRSYKTASYVDRYLVKLYGKLVDSSAGSWADVQVWFEPTSLMAYYVDVGSCDGSTIHCVDAMRSLTNSIEATDFIKADKSEGEVTAAGATTKILGDIVAVDSSTAISITASDRYLVFSKLYNRYKVTPFNFTFDLDCVFDDVETRGDTQTFRMLRPSMYRESSAFRYSPQGDGVYVARGFSKIGGESITADAAVISAAGIESSIVPYDENTLDVIYFADGSAISVGKTGATISFWWHAFNGSGAVSTLLLSKNATNKAGGAFENDTTAKALLGIDSLSGAGASVQVLQKMFANGRGGSRRLKYWYISVATARAVIPFVCEGDFTSLTLGSLPATTSEHVKFYVWVKKGTYSRAITDTMKKSADFCDGTKSSVDGWTLLGSFKSSSSPTLTFACDLKGYRVATLYIVPQVDFAHITNVTAAGSGCPLFSVDNVHGTEGLSGLWRPSVTLTK